MPEFEVGTLEARTAVGDNGQGHMQAGGIMGRRMRLEFDLHQRGSNGHSRFAPTNIAMSFADEDHPSKVARKSNLGSVMEISAPATEFTKFRSEAVISLADLDLGHVDWDQIPANQCLHLKSEDGTKYALAIHKKSAKALRFVSKPTAKKEHCGIAPRNIEQALALGCFRDDGIRLVTILGRAGSGKTLMALTAWWQLTHRGGHREFTGQGVSLPGKGDPEARYRRKLVVRRPTVGSGPEQGFLPGGASEKFGPFARPIFETLDLIREHSPSSGNEMMGVEIGPITFDRGLTIRDSFFIGDDIQNLTFAQVALLLTRPDDSSKVVLTGDPYQIDTPGLTYDTNGLIEAATRMHDSEITACIHLKHALRGVLAELVSERFGH